jgi:hypothetical protein
MANETATAAFARDLGYLDKFFANLTAHADTLPAAQGARLKQLMGEEVVRWREIRQLIAGQGGTPAQNPVATTTAPKGPQRGPEGPEPLRVPSPAPAPAPSPTVSAPASGNDSEKVRVNFTVGSLLGQPKK